MSDIEVANLSQKLGINIAVDLCGHTQGSRPGIFAARAAPVQINHLGFPGTSGSNYIDYYVADKYSVPPHEQKHFTEKIAYVPCVYTYDRQRKVSQKLLNKSDYGLPEKNFVFTCQNSVQKITPELFETWMNILKSVPSSILWLQDSNQNATFNLKREAELRGVEADRLIFMKREVVDWNQEQERISTYLLSYKFADLFLDTYPYNGGTTVLDALSVGLPVVTLCGNSHAARMASSALNAVEMNELIAKNIIEYQNLATQLALNPQKFERIKIKLKNNIQEKPLFDVLENVRHLENLYFSLIR
jgi:predicted O-linked N-acetylglucosamine transferase (SPINDLY family)